MRGLAGELVYPLCLPRMCIYVPRLVVIGVIMCGLALETSDAVVALIHLLAWRTWQRSGRFAKPYRDAVVHCKYNGQLEILAFGRQDYVALAWDPPQSFPGFVSVRIHRHDGKPLEILIFCRYDRRRSYRRLILHLKYHKD